MKRFGTGFIYLGSIVWIAFAVAKYLLGWDVAVRQFLPYHLAAIIPGVILKYGYTLYVRLTVRGKQGSS